MYTAAITIKQHLNDVREVKTEQGKSTEPNWISNLKSKIDSIRRKIAHIEQILTCKEKGSFTKRQLNIEKQLKHRYQNTKAVTLRYKLQNLKQDLKATSEKLKYQKRIHDRKVINRKFAINPKGVYRSMKQDNINIKKIPPKDEIERFWSDLWGTKEPVNFDAYWLPTLKDEY